LTKNWLINCLFVAYQARRIKSVHAALVAKMARQAAQFAGWRDRLDLEDLVHFDGWGGGDWAEFSRALEATKGMQLGLYE